MRSGFYILFTGIISLILSANHIFAANIDKNKAALVATNFYVEHSPVPVTNKSFTITESFLITEQATPVCYIFNFSNDGFVMVSADDIVKPVLGYSYEGKYVSENQSPEFLYWLGTYKKQISDAINSNASATPDIANEWLKLSVITDNFLTGKGDKTVSPLLASKWNQGSCYNALCPVDAGGPGGRCWAGCVAVAMAQVMYYYRYPLQGHGANSYYWDPYGYISADFSSACYNYDAMNNSCTGGNAEIAKLMYHCGVAVNMMYSPDGSGAYMFDVTASLPGNFKFSSSIEEEHKNNYTDAQWANKLINELDNKRPVIYAGFDDAYTSGHAFICDGYQGTDYFHFNWGWGGQADGYFYVNNLNPGGNNFSTSQIALFNVYPDGSYPYFCSGQKNITTSSGTIEDGSGPANYSANADCSWLITSACPGKIKLGLNNFSTEINDVLSVYDGADNTAPLLLKISGDTIPPSVSSSGDALFIEFKTDQSGSSSGWQLNYSKVNPSFCGITNLTAVSDTFSDGSGECDYNNYSNCKWLIEPPGVASVTLHFLNMDTEENNDKLRIIDPETSTLLETFSGSYIPPSVTSNSGKMLVIFNSNSSVTGQGWTACYTSSCAGTKDHALIKQLSVFPNPANEFLHVSFAAAGENNPVLQLSDITGRIVFSEVLQGNFYFNKDIDISEFPKGIYTLKITTNAEIINKKVVIN